MNSFFKLRGGMHDAALRSRELTIAVIGLGYWGPNLLRNLYESSQVAGVWACDLSRERLEAIGRRYPATTLATDYAQVLADPRVDAVMIATPISSHHRLAEAALNAGKHVFVEKPLAASSGEAASLITLAGTTGLVLMPGHTFLYSPPVTMIRSYLDSGDLGEVYFISASRVNLGLHQQDVSVAWDLGPHDFSILRYWLEETPERVSALARSCIIPEIPDVAFIDMQYASGAVAHAELSWLAPSKLRRTTIVGSRKMIVYDDTSTDPVRIFDSAASMRDPNTFGEFRMSYRTGDILSPHVEPAEPLGRELADFCRAILDGTTPRSSAELGLDVIRTIEAVDASLRSHGARVEVEPALLAV